MTKSIKFIEAVTRMYKDDWYRNETWDAQIEKRFNETLRHARLKQDFLRIQASYLTTSAPHVSLKLLEQYFALGLHFDMAFGWYDRAMAYISLGEIEHALEAFCEALEEEDMNSDALTPAYLSLPKLVAYLAIETWYEKAIEILQNNEHRRQRPRDHYEWNAVYALIQSQLRQHSEAKKHAQDALEIVKKQASGISYKSKTWIVRDDDMHKDLFNRTLEMASGNKAGLRGRFSRMLGHG
jgi:tetratricopeptide (TPR) repeat protein